jgi:uncharacterized protein (DUF305 family)
MKLNIFNKISLSKKNVCFLMAVIFIGRLSFAQQMDVHDMAPSKIQKNVFFGMMDTMMAKMDHAITGETVGTQFMLQMIPHHAGAVEMAEYEIKHGKDFAMIQLAKSIAAEQRNEVNQMQLWLKKRVTDTAKITEAFTKSFNETMLVMMQNMPAKSKLTDNDHAFAAVMIPHHQAAIEMAKVAIKFTKDQMVTAYCKHIISAEQIEIEQMLLFLKK